MAVSIEFFFKQFTKMNQTINCENGLQLIWSGGYTGRQVGRSYDAREDVPVYFIDNTNDSAYTKEALTQFIESKLDSFREIIPIDGTYITSRLYEIDSEEALFIPNKVLRNITKKLQEVTVDKSVDPVRLIGEFDGQFEISQDDENIHVYIDFSLSELQLNGEEIDSSHDDYDEWIDYFRYDNREFLEDEIWTCFSELTNNKNFYNYEWMGWYSNFYFIT
jgi:hypothetical protein